MDEEIQGVVEACAAQAAPKFEPTIQETLEGGGESDEEEVSDADEDLLEKCLEVVLQEKKASTSLLQRRLRLGYTRAARMIDILEERGVIGPGDGAKPREILVDLSDSYD
jgi:S-DNA-T family DNA segregation ATPase FtsK/SpoIIIE